MARWAKCHTAKGLDALKVCGSGGQQPLMSDMRHVRGVSEERRHPPLFLLAKRPTYCKAELAGWGSAHCRCSPSRAALLCYNGAALRQCGEAAAGTQGTRFLSTTSSWRSESDVFLANFFKAAESNPGE